MDNKNKAIKKQRKYPLLKTLLLIIGVCVALYIGFFSSLSFVTKHNKEVSVPEYMGEDFNIVYADLKKKGFKLDIDSTYLPDREGLEVIDQQPRPNKRVKKGRTLFLTVNKTVPPEIEMPNLVNLSYRSAEMILKNNKLLLGDTIVRPDFAKGAVLEMLHEGNSISAYRKIKQGETIDLVIGGGLEDMMFDIPDLIGVNYDEAIAILSSYSLHGNITFDKPDVDTFNTIVIGQSPKPYDENGDPNQIKENHLINLRMKEKAVDDDINDFFDEY